MAAVVKSVPLAACGSNPAIVPSRLVVGKCVEFVQFLQPKDGGLLASFSFDNSLLAIDGASNATIWDVARVKQVATLKADGKVLFSPTSLELAATDGNSLIFYVP